MAWERDPIWPQESVPSSDQCRMVPWLFSCNGTSIVEAVLEQCFPGGITPHPTRKEEVFFLTFKLQKFVFSKVHPIMQRPIVLSLHEVFPSWDFPWIYLEVIIISPLSCCFAKMYIACSFNLSISIKPSCYLIIIVPPLWTPSSFSISFQLYGAHNSTLDASCICSCVEKALRSSAVLQSISN